jgi:TonB family protein
MKNNGREVKVKDSADFIRIVSAPDSGQVYFNVTDYYKSGKLMLIGQSSNVYPVIFEGQQIAYYENGRKKSLSTYKRSRLNGIVQTYFPNGKLYKVSEPSEDIFFNKVIANYDSLGKQLVTDGNGYYKAYDDDFKVIAAEGTIKDGKRDGIWLFNDKTARRIETYVENKFVEGLTITPEGDSIKYTQKDIVPEFKGGSSAFTRFLEKNIKYPSIDRIRNIQGKVFASFVIEKDGTLAEIFVLRAPSETLGMEAMRVLHLSPPWSPGIQYGKPVRVQFTVPINFTLGPAGR